MSGDAIALAALCVTLLGILLGYVRKQAINETRFDFRITALEKSGEGLAKSIERLTDAVNKLDKHLYGERVASNIRASQGHFDQDDTDRPPKG